MPASHVMAMSCVGQQWSLSSTRSVIVMPTSPSSGREGAVASRRSPSDPLAGISCGPHQQPSSRLTLANTKTTRLLGEGPAGRRTSGSALARRRDVLRDLPQNFEAEYDVPIGIGNVVKVGTTKTVNVRSLGREVAALLDSITS